MSQRDKTIIRKILQYCKDSAPNSKSPWRQQVYSTYGCNKMERFLWLVQ